MAQVAWNHGWKTADLAKDNTIIYFDAVINAFKARFKQLGGKIKFETTYQDPAIHPGSQNFHAAASAIEQHPAKVIVTVTAGAFQALGPFMTDLRTANDKTPVLNSWAGDGTYWTNSAGHELLVRDVRERVRTRPEQGREQARERDEPPSRDRRVHHRAGRARRRRPGDQAGTRLARGLEARGGDAEVPQGAHDLGQGQLLEEAPLGLRSRGIASIEINNKTTTAKGTIVAKKVPHSPDQP